MDIRDYLGGERQNTSFDGTNAVDLFPHFTFDSRIQDNPDVGTITIQGVTIPCELWAVGEFKGFAVEVNHNCTPLPYLNPHMRVFPTDNNAGTFSFDFEWFVQHVDGTTSAGTTLNIAGEVSANDYQNGIGQYISGLIDGTGLVSGDILVGVVTRGAGTYTGDIAPTEVGMHARVDSLGDTF